MRVLLGACVSACVAVLASGAQPAMADGSLRQGSVVHVSVSGRMVVGSEAKITATGTNAPQGNLGFGPFGLVLYTVNHDALPIPCQTTENAEETLYVNNTRYMADLTFRNLDEGEQGPFSISTYVPITSPGHFQICAYSVLITDTAAWASTLVTIAPNAVARPAVARPTVTATPRVTRSGGRLHCSRGSWSGSPTSYTYRWRVLHRPGAAGEGPTLALTGSLHGQAVECSVSATNAAGSATATSPPFKSR
jgi:hypothetical protein